MSPNPAKRRHIHSHEIALLSGRSPEPDSPSDILALARCLALPPHELAAWLDLDASGIQTCHHCHEHFAEGFMGYCSFECYFCSRPRYQPPSRTRQQRQRKIQYDRRYQAVLRGRRWDWRMNAKGTAYQRRVRANPFT